VRVTPKVAITTASSPSPSLNYAPPPASGGGPTSTSYVVPPRPKPGRKPATDEPASKRKAQNRESQRAFRARKAAKLTDMQSQVETAEQRHRKEMNEKIALADELQKRIGQLESIILHLKHLSKKTAEERDHWKNRASQPCQHEQMARQAASRRSSSMTGWTDNHMTMFKSKLPSSRQDSPSQDSVSMFSSMATTPQAYDASKATEMGCGKCRFGGHCACLEEIANKLSEEATTSFMAAVPLNQGPSRTSVSPIKGVQAQMTIMDATTAALFADREIDFTSHFMTRKGRHDAPRPPIAFMAQSGDPESNCGFCTDDANCYCKTIHEPRPDNAASSSSDWTRATPNKVEATAHARATTGPGTCSDCMKNPKQRAWCRKIAQLENTEPTYLDSVSRTSSISSALDPLEPHPEYIPASKMHVQRHVIGCSDVYKLFDNRVPIGSESMDWSTLKPISASAQTNTLPGLQRRNYSALELDTASVIATLQSAMGSVQPRKGD
jgi:hypothetical protein